MSLKFIRESLVLLTLSLGICSKASAEIKVYEGEYLVKAPVLIGEVSAAAASEIKLYRKRNTDQLGVLSADPKVVPYDSNDTTCSDLLSSGEASYCEPNFFVEASVVSNDQYYQDLYGLSQIGAPQAWDKSVGADQIVAVIDTGIDYRHPDLAANVWVNPGEIAGNGIDDDSNGWIDDIHGINAFSGTGDPLDDNGHGTHVSGTIGASGNNSIGVVGVNWNVKIMGLKFLSSGGGGSIFGAIQAINYMVDMKNKYGLKLKVSNNSWGGSGYSKLLEDAIAKARDAGIVFVAAAGNEANNNDLLPSYPANYDLSNVVSVAAVDNKQSLAFFSNYGLNVDIAAPGVSILSTLTNGAYGKLSGTSMATPHVAGALALLSAYDSSLGVDGLTNSLYGSASYVAGLAGKVRTSAILNVASMLGARNPSYQEPEVPTQLVSRLSLRTSDGSSLIQPGDSLKIKIVATTSVANQPVDFYLNNKKCEQGKLVSLDQGANSMRTRIGSVRNGLKKLSVAVADKKASRNFDSSSISRRVSTKKLSARSHKTTCSHIIRSLR